jgi:hypothetical protein
MSSEMMRQIVEMIESRAHSRPAPIEFEMAYQARIAMDRIKFAIKHAEQFSKPCLQIREASVQLLEALDRLESLDRHFQARSRMNLRPWPASDNRLAADAVDVQQGRSPQESSNGSSGEPFKPRSTAFGGRS